MAELQDNRRRGRRVTASLPMTLNTPKGVFRGTTHNISLLGALVELDQQLSLGTAVTSQVGLPNGASVEAKGLIVRCEPVGPTPSVRFGVGIFFNSFSEGSEPPLSRWIEEVLEQQRKEAERYFEERERIRLAKLEKKRKEKELHKKRRKRGRPRKHPRKRAKRPKTAPPAS